jgi:hypothetical protein
LVNFHQKNVVSAAAAVYACSTGEGRKEEGEAIEDGGCGRRRRRRKRTTEREREREERERGRLSGRAA